MISTPEEDGVVGGSSTCVWNPINRDWTPLEWSLERESGSTISSVGK